MRPSGTIIVAALATVVLLLEPSAASRAVRSYDLGALEKSFANYSRDFRALESSSHSDDLEELEFLDSVATTAEDRLHSANVMLEMYYDISYPPDRAKVKPILRGQLNYYSWVMGQEADRTEGSLKFAKTPVVADMGLKMKDQLLAVKAKIQEITSSLT